MAFSKFDPHRPDDGDDFDSDAARRRAWMLTWGWRISMVFTAIGFGFIAYWIATGA